MHNKKTTSLALAIVLLMPSVCHAKGGLLLPAHHTFSVKDKLEISCYITAEDLQKIGISSDTKKFLIKAAKATTVGVPSMGASLLCFGVSHYKATNQNETTNKSVFLPALVGLALIGGTFWLISNIFKEETKPDAAKSVAQEISKDSNK